MEQSVHALRDRICIPFNDAAAIDVCEIVYRAAVSFADPLVSAATTPNRDRALAVAREAPALCQRLQALAYAVNAIVFRCAGAVPPLPGLAAALPGAAVTVVEAAAAAASAAARLVSSLGLSSTAGLCTAGTDLASAIRSLAALWGSSLGSSPRPSAAATPQPLLLLPAAAIAAAAKAAASASANPSGIVSLPALPPPHPRALPLQPLPPPGIVLGLLGTAPAALQPPPTALSPVCAAPGCAAAGGAPSAALAGGRRSRWAEGPLPSAAAAFAPGGPAPEAASPAAATAAAVAAAIARRLQPAAPRAPRAPASAAPGSAAELPPRAAAVDRMSAGALADAVRAADEAGGRPGPHWPLDWRAEIGRAHV